MNLLSRDPGKEKVQSIRAKTLPAVVTMPSRCGGAESRGAAVLQMPSRFQAARKAPVVITMPARTSSAQHGASLVEMPARFPSSQREEPVESIEPGTVARRKSQADRLGLTDSLRTTLIALFALLGWPWPTHGKDPGAAAARPWKLELLNVISKLELPTPANGRRLAARGAMPEFPQAISKSAHLVSAA